MATIGEDCSVLISKSIKDNFCDRNTKKVCVDSKEVSLYLKPFKIDI